jgi:2,5-diamino-6-(ribosylamino)-4(3H)-pyrimidinone 5'-phosphate reductase
LTSRPTNGMNCDELMQPDQPEIPGLYLGLEFPEPPPGRPFVFINMVASVDGKTTVDGSERGLGSDADKRVFYELRANADAVLNGANTLRISGSSSLVHDTDLVEWRREHNSRPQALGAVITASGDLPLDARFFTSREFEAVIFVSRSAPAERIERIRATGRTVHLISEGDQGVADAVRILHDQYGVRRLLCEGGATINAALIHQNLADELFLTIAPKIAGGRDNLTAVEGEPYHRDTMPPLTLVSWHHHPPTGEVFTRWRFVR